MARVFTQLKASAADAWLAYVDHDFVRQLGAGTLSDRAFIHYLKQDYVFLIHFSRAWALAVTKSDRIDEMRHAAATVHALVDFEMKLHVDVCAARGISEPELAATREEPANMAYTRFVIDAGLRGDLLDLLVALAPCVMGYGEIGRTLHDRIGGQTKDHTYGGWIDTYACDEFQQVCQAAGQLIDKVAGRLIGSDITSSPRQPDLTRTFTQACELEAGFWSMGLSGAGS